MKIHSNTFKTGDIVIVAFPFTDTDQTKNRPALVLSEEKQFNTATGHTILAMITSSLHSPWPHDIPITHLTACGLVKASIIRFKLFTLDNRLIPTVIGHLSPSDLKPVQRHLKKTFRSLLS